MVYRYDYDYDYDCDYDCNCILPTPPTTTSTNFGQLLEPDPYIATAICDRTMHDTLRRHVAMILGPSITERAAEGMHVCVYGTMCVQLFLAS